MPQFAALIYSRDVDWTDPEFSKEMVEYNQFSTDNGAAIRGGAALYQTSTATTVRVTGARGGDLVTTDGPYAETKEALTGFYLLEAPDLDAAIKIAAEIPAGEGVDLDEAVRHAARMPAAWNGAVEVRPVIEFGN